MNLNGILQGRAVALLERQSTKALLSDAYNNNIPQVNALMSAYDVGIITTILTSFPIQSLDRSNTINKLIKQHSLLEDKATWAVDQWIAAIDATLIKEIQ